MNNDPKWMKNFNFEKIYFDPTWNEEQKEKYYLKKRGEKLEIYIELLVVISCFLGGVLFFDFLINISILALLVLGGHLIQFRRKYFSFRDIEENEKF